MSELKPRQFSKGEEAAWLADKVCILGDYGKDAARVLRKQTGELEQLRARNAELERQLAEANARAEQAEQRIAESQIPEFFGDDETIRDWHRGIRHGGATDLRIVGKALGRCTTPLYASPIIPPDVEEAVKAENECCVKIILAQDVDPAFKNRIADAIRARSEK